MQNDFIHSLEKQTFWQEVQWQYKNNVNLDNEEKAIDYVCLHYPELVNQPEIGGLYPIHIMISKINFQRTQRLLLANANLDLKVKMQKNSPPCLATRLAERFVGLNAKEIATYYKNNITGSRKLIAKNIYELIFSFAEKEKLSNNLSKIDMTPPTKISKI